MGGAVLVRPWSVLANSHFTPFVFEHIAFWHATAKV